MMHEYHLHDLIERLESAPALGGEMPVNGHKWLDFNDAKEPIELVLSQKVHAGGVDAWTRFEGISRVIGHWLRRYHSGMIDDAEAWEEICSYNAACVVPPWPEEKLKAETNRLWRKHLHKYGPASPAQTIISPPPTLTHFSARKSLDAPEAVTPDIIGPRVLTPGGLWLIAGPPKVGKSDFLLSLFSHASAGRDFLCFSVNRPLRILYVQAEIETAYLQERYQRIVGAQRDGFEAGLDNLVMTSRFQFQLDDRGIEAIAAAASEAFAEPVDITALDPFRNLY